MYRSFDRRIQNKKQDRIEGQRYRHAFPELVSLKDRGTALLRVRHMAVAALEKSPNNKSGADLTFLAGLTATCELRSLYYPDWPYSKCQLLCSHMGFKSFAPFSQINTPENSDVYIVCRGLVVEQKLNDSGGVENAMIRTPGDCFNDHLLASARGASPAAVRTLAITAVDCITVNAAAFQKLKSEETKLRGADDTLFLLQQLPLFRCWDQYKLRRLAFSTTLVEIPAGEVLYTEGETSDSLMIIQSGFVNVSLNGCVVASLSQVSHSRTYLLDL